MIVSGTYQGVNANTANKGTKGAGWCPGAVLDLGPESLDFPLDMPVPHCLCDPNMFLILSSCHLGLHGIQTTLLFGG